MTTCDCRPDERSIQIVSGAASDVRLVPRIVAHCTRGSRSKVVLRTADDFALARAFASAASRLLDHSYRTAAHSGTSRPADDGWLVETWL